MIYIYIYMQHFTLCSRQIYMQDKRWKGLLWQEAVFSPQCPWAEVGKPETWPRKKQCPYLWGGRKGSSAHVVFHLLICLVLCPNMWIESCRVHVENIVAKILLTVSIPASPKMLAVSTWAPESQDFSIPSFGPLHMILKLYTCTEMYWGNLGKSRHKLLQSIMGQLTLI